MKLSALVIFVCAAAVSGAEPAPPALFPIVQNGKTGFIDSSGSLVIAPTADILPSLNQLPHFAEGLEPVEARGKLGWFQGWGYLDRTGKMAVAPDFSLTLPFSEGLAAVRDSQGRYGYIDHTGHYVIEPQFTEAYPFSEGLAQVGTANHLMGFIDKTGAFVIPARSGYFSPHSNFSEGLACVESNGLWGYINRRGTMVIPAKFKSPSSFSDGLAVVDTGRKYGYINKSGAFAIPPKYNFAWGFSEGIARVELRGQMAFIDRHGSVLFSITNGNWAGTFSEGLANVSIRTGSKPELWGYINRAGEFVIPPRFQRAEPFRNGLALVIVNGRSAYINKSGSYVWGPHGFNEALSRDLKSQNNEAERIENNRDILRLASQLNPEHPPITAQMLQSGEGLSRAIEGISAQSQTAGIGPAEALLGRLLRFNLPPAMCDQMPDFAQEAESSVRQKAAQALVAAGSPAVVPVLREWFQQGLEAAGARRPYRWSQVNAAIRNLAKLRDTSVLPALISAWKSGAFDKPVTISMLDNSERTGRQLRRALAMSLSEMPVPESRPILLEVMNTNALSYPVRCQAAAALVRLDDSAGRDFLLRGFESYLATAGHPEQAREQADYAYAERELEALGDAGLIAALRTKEEAAPEGVAKKRMISLREKMQINALPVEDLKRMAGEKKNLDKRLSAITALGRNGTADILPFLESLAARANDYRRPGRRRILLEVVHAAIRRVRQHNWQELEHKNRRNGNESPTPIL